MASNLSQNPTQKPVSTNHMATYKYPKPNRAREIAGACLVFAGITASFVGFFLAVFAPKEADAYFAAGAVLTFAGIALH